MKTIKELRDWCTERVEREVHPGEWGWMTECEFSCALVEHIKAINDCLDKQQARIAVLEHQLGQ